MDDELFYVDPIYLRTRSISSFPCVTSVARITVKSSGFGDAYKAQINSYFWINIELKHFFASKLNLISLSPMNYLRICRNKQMELCNNLQHEYKIYDSIPHDDLHFQNIK